eukprot:746152-Hanusia_phi.AAC.10
MSWSALRKVYQIDISLADDSLICRRFLSQSKQTRARLKHLGNRFTALCDICKSSRKDFCCGETRVRHKRPRVGSKGCTEFVQELLVLLSTLENHSSLDKKRSNQAAFPLMPVRLHLENLLVPGPN